MMYEPAAPVIPRLVNVATPPVAVAVVVPVNVEPAEPAVIAAVIMAVADEPAVTVKEFVSWIVIVGCEFNCPPLVAVAVGRLVASFVAADAVTVTVVVATVREPAE